jgi:hypothetical protein
LKRRVYCLTVRESLSHVGSLESFRATLTKNLSNDCCFWENRLNFEYVTLIRQTSSTRIAKHRSFIKLKFLQNFCSSCKTLADQVALNPRFYCTLKVGGLCALVVVVPCVMLSSCVHWLLWFRVLCCPAVCTGCCGSVCYVVQLSRCAQLDNITQQPEHTAQQHSQYLANNITISAFKQLIRT